jgi:beta-lactamase class A
MASRHVSAGFRTTPIDDSRSRASRDHRRQRCRRRRRVPNDRRPRRGAHRSRQGVSRGELDESLPIWNEFKSIVDGSLYKLSEGDDSDKEIYAAVGKTLTLRQLCEAMITVSSNFAANLLIERVGVENIRATLSRLGADGMQVLRGVEDQKAFDKGMNNQTTARALEVLMLRIAQGQAVSPKADSEMAAILKRQKFHDAIPAGLPEGTIVGHKTGNITKIHHDAAIVYGPRPYVLVVLVRGVQDQKVSGPLIASISREVWNTLNVER